MERICLALLVAVTGCTTAPTELHQAETTITGLSVTSAPAEWTGLRALAAKRSLLIGGALRQYPDTMADPEYTRTFAREFNVVVPEHVLKFAATHPQEKVFDFKDGDALIAYAKANGMKVRGHTLIWHDAIPPWVFAYKDSPAALAQLLHTYVSNVVDHFRGKLLSWDVVNEALDEDGKIFVTRGPWPKIDSGRKPGDYVRDAFVWAHEADPDVQLFYNDYGAETLNKKSDGIYALVKKLKADGVPIHGIGFQTHIAFDQDLAEASVRANFKRFADLGLKIHITEMDVGIPKARATDPQALAMQAEQYRKFMAACLATKGCEAFLTWGLADKFSWIDDSPDKTAALLLDRHYRPKPAYAAIFHLLETP